MLRHYFHAYQKLQALGAEEEAELYGTVWKYGIVFDISKEEIEDAAETVNSGMVEQEGCETLRGLKSGLQKLLFIRKLFFCTVLAIEATEGNADFGKWSVAIQTMRHLTAETARFTTNIDNILNGEISKFYSCHAFHFEFLIRIASHSFRNYHHARKQRHESAREGIPHKKQLTHPESRWFDNMFRYSTFPLWELQQHLGNRDGIRGRGYPTACHYVSALQDEGRARSGSACKTKTRTVSGNGSGAEVGDSA